MVDDAPSRGGGISELRLLDDIDEISYQYELQTGIPPINLSHWDQSRSLQKRLKFLLPQGSSVSPVEYLFSYTQDNRVDLLKAYSLDENKWGCLVSHSGSSAIVAVAHWLKVTKRLRVLVLGPRYFTVPYAMNCLGLTMHLTHCKRSEQGYLLPDDFEDICADHDAVWITNPIYCTGLDYLSKDIARLEILSKSGITLIIDECLCEAGRNLVSLFPPVNVIAITAPHKSICVNGLKFAVIFFPANWQDTFDSWSDVWFGCLPMSSALAIKHFLSPNFTLYRNEFKIECELARQKVFNIILCFHSIELDINSEGYLISVFVPRLASQLGLELSFLQRATTASGATFISGLRNELDPSAGLSFRVNLAAFDAAAEGALHRLCVFLEREALG